MLTVKKVKIDTEYRFRNEIVKVAKRIKNSYKEKWHYGFGSKNQKIEHRKETTFLLNNGIEVFAKELSLLNGL
jgi:hypothetical protein